MESLRKFRKGIEEITPLQQLRAKRIGYAGQVVGMLLAMIATAWQGYSHFLLFLFFVLFVLVVELIGVHQQVARLEGFSGGKDNV